MKRRKNALAYSAAGVRLASSFVLDIVKEAADLHPARLNIGSKLHRPKECEIGRAHQARFSTTFLNEKKTAYPIAHTQNSAKETPQNIAIQ